MQCDPLTPAGIKAIHQRLKDDERTKDWMASESDVDTILQVAFAFGRAKLSLSKTNGYYSLSCRAQGSLSGSDSLITSVATI